MESCTEKTEARNSRERRSRDGGKRADLQLKELRKDSENTIQVNANTRT